MIWQCWQSPWRSPKKHHFSSNGYHHTALRHGTMRTAKHSFRFVTSHPHHPHPSKARSMTPDFKYGKTAIAPVTILPELAIDMSEGEPLPANLGRTEVPVHVLP